MGDGVSAVVTTDVAELVVVVVEVGPPAKYHMAPAIKTMIARTKAIPLMSMDIPPCCEDTRDKRTPEPGRALRGPGVGY